MRIAAACAAFVLLVATNAFAADPAGRYRIDGTNPGSGSTYTGTVTVSRTGETWSVVWLVGNTRYVGTGIGDSNFIAVSYRAGNATGLALYGAEGGNWKGVWAYAGGQQIGTERWLRE